MKISKKVLALMLACLLVFGALVGCADNGGASSAAGTPPAGSVAAGGDVDDSLVNTELSGEITQWVWGDYEIRGAVDFNKYYPNIKVNYVSVPSDEYEQKILTALATGTDLPDVVNIESAARGQFNNMDVWERLDAAPYNLDTSKVLPIGIPLMSNEKGEIVCVQVDNCVAGYAYDRELAIKYFGTDDPAEMEKIFSDLDSFVEKSKAVGEAGEDYMFASVDDAYSAVSGLYQKDPVVVDGKLNTDKSVLPTYEFIEKLVANKAVGPYVEWTPAWYTSFASNNIIFYRAPAWFISFMMKPNDPDSVGKWGMMTPPGGGFNAGGTAYAIPKGAKEENKELAWAYIQWLTLSQEGAESFYNAHATSTLYAPAYDTDLYKGEPDPFFKEQNVTEKLNEIAADPRTTASIMTAYDFVMKNANAQALRDLEAGMSAQQAYAKFKTEVLAAATDLSE
ncbi:extracellular solute-binding protein [Ruminococcaceae bacterium OttesenSCG-928-A16]|nr:extracellular solute-binding protein [Ruminococcaceae bacterium OttesenSCG-928-A16]